RQRGSVRQRGRTREADPPGYRRPDRVVAQPVSPPARVRGSTPAVARAQRVADLVEAGPVQHRALAPDAVLPHREDPVEPDPARPALAVPRARAERQPVPLAVALALARQHEAEQRPALPADHQHGAVLTLARVVLV